MAKVLASAIFGVVPIDFFDRRCVGSSELLRFVNDRAALARYRSPIARSGDLADTTSVLAKVPVGTFAFAVVLLKIYLHVIGRRTQSNFKASRIFHKKILLSNMIHLTE